MSLIRGLDKRQYTREEPLSDGQIRKLERKVYINKYLNIYNINWSSNYKILKEEKSMYTIIYEHNKPSQVFIYN